MKRLIAVLFVLTLPLLATLPVIAQTGDAPKTYPGYPVAPKLPCVNFSSYVNTSNGKLYTCKSAVWVQQASPTLLVFISSDPQRAKSIEHICRPISQYNPDAGVGFVTTQNTNPDAGMTTYRAIAATTQSASVSYWCWREGLTKDTIKTVCQQRAVGNANGNFYGEQIDGADLNVSCYVPDDGGISWQVELGQ